MIYLFSFATFFQDSSKMFLNWHCYGVLCCVQKGDLCRKWCMALSLMSRTMMVSMLFPYAYMCQEELFLYKLATLSFFSIIGLIVGSFGYCRQQEHWNGIFFSSYYHLLFRDVAFRGLKPTLLVCVHQVNHIRDSLAVMGDNSTAFSLPQVWVLIFSCICHIFLAFS